MHTRNKSVGRKTQWIISTRNLTEVKWNVSDVTAGKWRMGIENYGKCIKNFHFFQSFTGSVLVVKQH